MTKLSFTKAPLSNVAIPNLTYAYNKIDAAYRTMYSLSIPDSFAYKTKLIEFINDLIDYKKDVNYTEDWLRDSYTKYKLLEDKIDSSINLISKESFKLRESIVKRNLS